MYLLLNTSVAHHVMLQLHFHLALLCTLSLFSTSVRVEGAAGALWVCPGLIMGYFQTQPGVDWQIGLVPGGCHCLEQ